MSNFCCVCLELSEITHNINERNESDINYCEKLKAIVPEAEWLNDYLICQDCSGQLNACYDFWKKCSEMEEKRRSLLRDVFCDPHQTLSDLEDNIEIDKTSLEIFKCFKCASVFETQEILLQHIENTHTKETKNKPPKKKFVCEFCSAGFALLKVLLKHCSDIHKTDAKHVRPYLCEFCDSRFKTGANLIQHKSYQHSTEATHLCSVCGKGFKAKSDLTFHEYTHLNKRSYKCSICDKAYNTNQNLRAHILVVHADKNSWKYSCSYCPKKFPFKSNFDQHVKRHFGEKAFVCEFCDKAFISKGEMTKHVRLHSNVPRFKCQVCEKDYKVKRNLDIHLTKDHGIGNTKLPTKYFKKYSCNICAKEFSDKETLFKHLCLNTKTVEVETVGVLPEQN